MNQEQENTEPNVNNENSENENIKPLENADEPKKEPEAKTPEPIKEIEINLVNEAENPEILKISTDANPENADEIEDDADDEEMTAQKNQMYKELTDFMQKQMDLINSMKRKDFAKLSQNIDIVDAIKFEHENPHKSTQTDVRYDKLTKEDFLQKVNEGKNIANYDLRDFHIKHEEITKPVNFFNCTFKNLKLKSTVFNDNVTFTKCTFRRFDFNRSKFQQNLKFEACELKGSTIKGFTVNGCLNIARCKVKNRIVITKVKAQNIDMWGTKFAEWVEINNCTFFNMADFRSIDIEGGLEIVKCHFENDWIMRGANIQRPIYVRDSTIKGCFDFQRAKFRDFAYFDELHFLEGSSIALWNVVSHGIFISPEQLENRLCSQQKGDFKTAAAEFGALKANYQFLNRLDDEDWAYFRFKKMNRLANKDECTKITSKCSNFFEWLFFEFGSKYGTKPLRVLGLSLFFILLFAVIYIFPCLFNYEKGKKDSLTQPDIKTYHITGTAVLDVPLSALLVSSGAFVSGFDAVDKNVEGWVSIILALEALTGMLFLGLFIVSFSRKVIR